MKSLKYIEQTADCNDILTHLREISKYCDGFLVKVKSVEAYAQKLADRAVLCEAWLDDELVGLLAGYLDDRNNAFISNLSVVSSVSRRGVGSELMRMFLQTATIRSAKVISLEIAENNKAAEKFYQTFGFEYRENMAKTRYMTLAIE